MPTSSFGAIRVPIVDDKGIANRDFLKKLQEWEAKLQTALTLFGQISKSAVIQGRTEGIGTTVQKLNSTGQLGQFTDVVAGRTTDNLADGTGSPLTGGKRGFVALDTNNRLANSFRQVGVNVNSCPTSDTVLSNDGVSTAITIGASTGQFAPGTVSYNSGSVDPGAFGKAFIFADDPTFAGGAVTYSFSLTADLQTAAEGRTLFGRITSVNGSAKTGGGRTGGTGGSTGGRGFNQ